MLICTINVYCAIFAWIHDKKADILSSMNKFSIRPVFFCHLLVTFLITQIHVYRIILTNHHINKSIVAHKRYITFSWLSSGNKKMNARIKITGCFTHSYFCHYSLQTEINRNCTWNKYLCLDISLIWFFRDCDCCLKKSYNENDTVRKELEFEATWWV